ncbi:MAG: DUF2917 domain-containing protein [Deltaproteobacteria bacterium]|nr:DUF2917 domain-containing protein [Deltaproteobacteria bacterium]
MTSLPNRTVVSVDGPAGGLAIACDSGAAWITQCCDPMDHVLTAGMDFAPQKGGKITVQVIKDGKISIRLRNPPSTEPYDSPSGALRIWRASIYRWARRFFPGGQL